MAATPTEISRVDGGNWLVAVHGQLTYGTSTAFERTLRQISEDRPAGVAIDLAEVWFMDSSGVKALLSARKRLAAVGARLALLRPHQMPLSLLQRMQLDRFLEVAGSLEEAFPSRRDPASVREGT